MPYATSLPHVPQLSMGFLCERDDKQKLRINVLSHILSRIPYKSVKMEKVKLPKREKASEYKSPDLPLRFVPEVKIPNKK